MKRSSNRVYESFRRMTIFEEHPELESLKTQVKDLTEQVKGLTTLCQELLDIVKYFPGIGTEYKKAEGRFLENIKQNGTNKE